MTFAESESDVRSLENGGVVCEREGEKERGWLGYEDIIFATQSSSAWAKEGETSSTLELKNDSIFSLVQEMLSFIFVMDIYECFLVGNNAYIL